MGSFPSPVHALWRRPLRLYLDASCGETLRQVCAEPAHFRIEADAAAADVVVFGTDEVAAVRASAVYRRYPGKSLCITESDTPTFRLPGLYAANEKGWLGRGRTRTIPYLLSERERPNLEVRRLAGGTPEKRYLYSFMGGTNSWPRRRLFAARHPESESLVESTDAYDHWNRDARLGKVRADQMRRRYAEVMAASKYALCPRGCGVSSYRLFESMSLGVAPVIVADRWKPIEGIDWSFAIFMPERHIPETARVVRSYEAEWRARGEQARAVYHAVLAPDVIGRMLLERMREVVAGYDARREAVMALLTEARAAGRAGYWKAYAALRSAALLGSRTFGVRLPVKMRQPPLA